MSSNGNGQKLASELPMVVPKHGRGKLLTGGVVGHRGAGGRPPDEFKRLCQRLASRAETIRAVKSILRNPDHPAFQGALRWATENGYGRPAQAVDISSGGQPMRFTLSLGQIGTDDSDG